LIDACQAWQSDQAFGFQWARAYALVLIGHAQTQAGHFVDAATAYQQALTLYTEIDRAELAAEAQAGLAAIAYNQGDWAQAQRLVETVLKLLVDYPTAGQDEPFYLYLTCYRILAAANDPRAIPLLRQGYTLLQQYADQITDDALRRSFWEKVPIHAALHQAYSAQATSDRCQ
jgi:tetratricopeptide (TPR) repeat protein